MDVAHFLSFHRRKVHSAPAKLNPMFNEASVKERPQISQPTLMQATVTQACTPLMAVTPCRPAPQVQTIMGNKQCVVYLLDICVRN